jgi:putative transposase
LVAALHEQVRLAVDREAQRRCWSSTHRWPAAPHRAGKDLPRPRRRYGATLGAKRVVAVDVTGMPVGAIVVPASTTESRATELLLEHLAEVGVTDRLELVLVDRGTTARAARQLSRRFGLEVRQVFWPDRQPTLRPIALAWRVEVAHGLLGRSRQLAKSFENTTTSATGWLQVACVALLLRELAPAA